MESSSPAYTLPQFDQRPRVAFIADVPKKGTPYSISEGYLYNLRANCEAAGIDVLGCFLGSVLETYPGFVPTGAAEGKGRNKTMFDWDDPTYVISTSKLEVALAAYQPDVIIPLGQLALRYFKRGAGAIDDERGAPFLDPSGRLCLATYHPRDLFMRHELTSLVQFDIGKAVRLARDGWKAPVYNINCLPTYADAVNKLQSFITRKPYLSVDIETFYGTKNPELDGLITCISFAYSASDAIVIPLVGKHGGSKRYWPKEQEIIMWQLMNTVLRTCPCVGHNAVHFDFQQLARKHFIQSNFIDDTMFAHWSCYPEMSKSLSFCSALYTDNPYWKDELKAARSGKIPRWKEFEYCGRDTIICMQVAIALGKELKEKGKHVREHYKFNVRVSRAYEYMAATGAQINEHRLNEKIIEISAQAENLQSMLNDSLGRKLNVKSPKQVKDYLFGELGLPERTTTFKNPDGTQGERVTADYLTTLYLARKFPDEPTIETIGTLRKIHKRISSLQKIKYDAKHTCRWGFNVVGTETGRSSGYKPNDGLGIQPQNVDRRDRDIFIPPENHHWVKADLEGADSVTVAACLEALGDPRLHEDLKFGIKPAQTLALAVLLKDNGVMSWTKHQIKARLGELKGSAEGKKCYSIAKAINHGSAYMLSPGGMHSLMFKQSDGLLYILPKECEAMQNLLFARYDYPLYHRQMKTMMNSSKTLRAFSGQERFFFGRADNSTLRKMLAYLPQAHTAFATNTAIERLYYHESNRSGNDLILRLCNQVHDETDFYMPIGRESQGHDIFYGLCEVPMKIWGVDFQIEFEAQYGPHWGSQPNDL